jgi:hypothetical protein
MVSLKFHCKDEKDDFIQLDINHWKDGLFIELSQDGNIQIVTLDKSTAIKFSKELRKQIALLD